MLDQIGRSLAACVENVRGRPWDTWDHPKEFLPGTGPIAGFITYSTGERFLIRVEATSPTHGDSLRKER